MAHMKIVELITISAKERESIRLSSMTLRYHVNEEAHTSL